MRTSVRRMLGRAAFRALEITHVLLHSLRRRDLKILTASGITTGVQRLPDWSATAVNDVSSFEPELSTKKFDSRMLREHVLPAHARLSESFAAIADRLKAYKRPAVMIFCPWLAIGGSDEATLQLLKLISPSDNALLVITESNANLWMNRVPPSTQIMDISEATIDLSNAEKAELVARLVCQIAPRVMHVVNSEVAWMAIAKYGTAISNFSDVHASLFCDEILPGGEKSGYARWYLRDAYPAIKAVYVDNQQFPEEWSMELGIPRDTFIYLPMYVSVNDVSAPRRVHRSNGETPRVLWVGRNSEQKQPAIVLEIAKRLPNLSFDLFGVESSDLHGFDTPSNLQLFGYKEDFNEVDLGRYDVFLNTSLWDGLPYVIKQVGAAMLPIVSTTVGGIRTLLNDRNSFLVDDPRSVEGFVAAIKDAITNPDDAMKRAMSCYNLLREKHDWNATRAVLALNDYFGEN